MAADPCAPRIGRLSVNSLKPDGIRDSVVALKLSISQLVVVNVV